MWRTKKIKDKKYVQSDHVKIAYKVIHFDAVIRIQLITLIVGVSFIFY